MSKDIRNSCSCSAENLVISLVLDMVNCFVNTFNLEAQYFLESSFGRNPSGGCYSVSGTRLSGRSNSQRLLLKHYYVGLTDFLTDVANRLRAARIRELLSIQFKIRSLTTEFINTHEVFVLFMSMTCAT